jgi:DNA-binding IscR family transcriptional regulator
VDATLCLVQGICLHTHHCITHYLWVYLREHIHNFLSSFNLAQLVERRLAREQLLELKTCQDNQQAA